MDNLTPAQRRKNMSNIRSVGTVPEKLIARELRKRRIYFSRNVKSLVGKPDFVFRKKKIVVFIDSDFWHGHPTRCVMPKSNCDYWNEKILRNRNRDKKVNRHFKKDGWEIVRIWEYDLKRDFQKSFEKIIKILKLEQKEILCH